MRADTAEAILDTMQELIQARGFNAISYQDIADRIGIRKASIHYHFPTKFSLGAAVIERYRRDLLAVLAGAEAGSRGGYRDVLAAYLRPFGQFVESGDKVCLCGALAGEFAALPKAMQAQVSQFFIEQQAWLERLFERGRAAGEFRFAGSARAMARCCFSALQGALLIRRATGDGEQIRDVIDMLQALVRGWLESPVRQGASDATDA
jgi:TetR/AcrR family transcriptional repressor of nem operon